ncbi:MAG: Fe-S cluster assembly protein SufD [Pseudomonadota bacterium]
MKALNPEQLPSIKEEQWKYTNLSRVLKPELLSTSEENNQSVEIHIKAGEVLDASKEIVFIGFDKALHTNTLKIVLEDNAEATIVEKHDGRGHYWKNCATEIIVGKNAKLHHVRLQEDSAQGVNTNMVSIEMEQDALYDLFTLNIGGQMTRHDIHAKLKGANGELHLNGVNLLGDEKHGDTTILIEHEAPHCQSNQFYRSILDDKARGVFQGKVHVHKPAQKTDGYQLSNAILLSDQAEMDTKPELEIYADDVKCSHGATTGQLDEEPVFYLRSRGLSEKQARELLIQAFVDEAVDKISNEELQETVRGKTSQWLSDKL